MNIFPSQHKFSLMNPLFYKQKKSMHYIMDPTYLHNFSCQIYEPWVIWSILVYIHFKYLQLIELVVPTNSFIQTNPWLPLNSRNWISMAWIPSRSSGNCVGVVLIRWLPECAVMSLMNYHHWKLHRHFEIIFMSVVIDHQNSVLHLLGDEIRMGY